MPIRLSVLDQSPAVRGQLHDVSIRETVALAQHCERLGYHRYWLSEHHSHPTIVGTAPEVLLAAIAATTSRIRLGSAGVMLPHYAALKVAEQFRVLDALAPGRIDLGVGRAPGSDMRTALLLNPDRHASEHFPNQVLELRIWTQGGAMPQDHPGHGVHAFPAAHTAPTLWMLGSSDYGARLAAAFGLPYAFAWFITDGQGASEALRMYREGFRPSETLKQPETALCVWALAADTEEEAWHQFKSRERSRMDRNTGRLGPLLPPEEAERELTPSEQVQRDGMRRTAMVGTARQVGDKLRELAEELQTEELVVITWTHGDKARRRSYELLAAEFGLGAG